MFRKRCARSSTTAFRGTRVQHLTLDILIFYFAVFMIAVPCFAGAESSAERPDPAAPHLASASGVANPETAANLPSLPRKTTQIIVGVSINTEGRGDFFVELDDAGVLYLKVEDLINLKLGFDPDRTVLIHGDKFVPLNAVRDIRFTFDEKKLTVDILGKTTEKRQTSIEIYPVQRRPQDMYYPRETSLFLNYGLTYAYANQFGFQSFTASNKFGARTGDVFFVSDSLYTETPAGSQFVRLSSSATYERRDDLQWIVLGDQIASSGELGSVLNMGGIGFSKVYRLDPYYITQPMQSIQGITQFPTQAEIYVDGVLAGRHPIAPGSFELKNIYSYAGAHIVEVLLRDPFGNEQRLTYPMYFSDQLLREGNHEYSYNAGFLREQFGTKSDEYGKAAFSAFHRYGVSSSFNIGARAEGSDGVYNGGVSTSLALPKAGIFTLALSGSSANSQQGSAGTFRHSYQLGSFNTNLQVSGFSREYATVGVPPTQDMTKFQASMGVGFLIPAVGGVAITYSDTGTYSGVNTRVTSASYSRGLTKTASLFATASSTRIFETTYSFFVGLNFTPAKDIHGAIQYNKTGDADTETVQIQKDVPVGEGLGYRASLNRTNAGASTSYLLNPSLQYNARYGIYSLDVDMQHSNGNTTESYNVSAAGSIVYAGGFYGFSRPVSDSFGIISVDKVAGAKVLNNGQEIGQTDSSGTLVVPTLASYNQNQITLDMKNLPMDYSVSRVGAKLAPSLWSGSCVDFDVVKVRALAGSLYMQKKDKKIPLEFVDVIVKVGDREATFPTGKGGEFYIENIFPGEPKAGSADRQSCHAIAERKKSGGDSIHPGIYPAWVELEGGRCKFSIFFPETEDVITDIGEVECIMSGK